MPVVLADRPQGRSLIWNPHQDTDTGRFAGADAAFAGRLCFCRVYDSWITATLASGHSKSDAKTYGGHLYATYLAPNDAYVDLVLGYVHNTQDLHFAMADGTGVAGKFSLDGFGASVESGHQFARAQTEHRSWFVEPQLQLSYFHVSGADYGFTNGMRIHRASADSVIGRAGVVLGQTFRAEDEKF